MGRFFRFQPVIVGGAVITFVGDRLFFLAGRRGSSDPTGADFFIRSGLSDILVGDITL